MGVYIKGMEMPKNCIDCAFGWNGWCHRINSRAFVEVDMRRHDCPLIEIPDGHGRLIDADALKSYMEECKGENAMAIYATGYARSFIDNSPTVIPSDKEEVKHG